MSGGKVDSNFKQLITETVEFLQGNLSWLTSLSAKQRFCWGILSTCCSKIAIASDHLEWVYHYSTIFVDLQLGLVYTTYCTGKKLPNEKRIIVSQLPADVQANSSEDLHRYSKIDPMVISLSHYPPTKKSETLPHDNHMTLL